MEKTITVNDFQSICRACLCDCKDIKAVDVLTTFIYKNVVADVLSKYASIQVSKDTTVK